jgi:NAD(P)-dependent dehydrogenase (short-subunit alcohol dehydrogenase family)
MKSAIVMGVGPDRGLGAQLCKRLAAHGLHVLVAGRTQAKLDAVVAGIVASGASAQAVVADAASEADTFALFSSTANPIDVAIYNAGNNTPGRIVDMDAAYFEQSWRVGCYGGFLFGREAIRHMLPNGTGTLLFTGASASLRGRANFGAFNSAKGALRNLAQAMSKEYGAEGIHVGHVIVDGPIGGEKIMKNRPDIAAKLGEEGMISIEGIVDAYEYLYRQPRRAWSFELDVRTSIENW